MGEVASWIENRFFLPLCFRLILELIKTNEKVVKMLEKRKIQTKVNEYLWYIILIEFQLFGTVWAMMNVSGKPYLLLYWGFIALALVKLCIQGNSWKEWILIIAFGIVSVLSFRSSQDKTPLLLMLGVCCSKDMNLEKFLKIDLVGRVVSAFLLIALPLAGFYENKIFFARDIYRTCFGWQAPNGMGFSFMVMAMEWMYLRHRRFHWYDYTGILAIIVFIDRTANSRTAELLMLGILAVELFYTYIEKKKPNFNLYKLCGAGCWIALIADIGLFGIAMGLYFFNQPMWSSLQSTLMNRFRLPGEYFEAHGISLFGSPYNPDIYDYLDILFGYLTLHLGVVIAVIVLVLFVISIIYGYRRKDEKYLILLLFVLLRSTMESEHLNLIYSWFPVLLGMAVWGIREKTLEI